MTQPLEKYPAESALFDLNCSDSLGVGETITGTPAMSFLPGLTGGDAITFGTPVINGAEATYPDGTTAAIGKAIQVRIIGGTVPDGDERRAYTVLATFTTNQGNTLIARGRLDLVPL